MVVTKHSLASADSDSQQTIRIVQLTDLHLREIGRHAHRIAAAANDARPDMIVLTGDSIDDRTKVRQLGEFMSLLDPRPTKFATLGNWEHWGFIDLVELAATYRKSGCRLLVNETAAVEHHGQQVLVTGIDDWTGGRPDLARALKTVVPRPNHIVLAHSPVYRDVMVHELNRLQLTDYSIAAVLSGHTHGGQVALFGWAPVRPAGSGTYVAGWYEAEGKPPLYVSRGLGTSIAPIRFGSTPEVAVVDWQLAGA